jgi:hypothetical protein
VFSARVHDTHLPLSGDKGEECAASAAVVKFGSLIKQLALSRDTEAKGIFSSEYLTWDELISTRYFSVPRFRMLVAN